MTFWYIPFPTLTPVSFYTVAFCLLLKSTSFTWKKESSFLIFILNTSGLCPVQKQPLPLCCWKYFIAVSIMTLCYGNSPWACARRQGSLCFLSFPTPLHFGAMLCAGTGSGCPDWGMHWLPTGLQAGLWALHGGEVERGDQTLPVCDRKKRSPGAVNFWLNEGNLLLKSTFYKEVLTSNAACVWWGLEAVRSTSLLVSVVWMWRGTVRTKSHLNRGDLFCSINATLCAFWSSEHILKLISLWLDSNWLRVGLGESSGPHLWASALCPAHLQGSAWALLWCLNRGCAGPRPKQVFFGEPLFP